MSQDPTIEVVHLAVGFATAAVNGDDGAGLQLAARALDLDAIGFLDALMTTIQAVADEADEAGADTSAQLRELGLGIHLAALGDLEEDEANPRRQPPP